MADNGAAAPLPQVVLSGRSIPADVLKVIPLATVERYQVAAFELGDTVLKLAIVHPEQLKQGFYTALKDMGAKVERQIELFKTDYASMQSVIKQYRAAVEEPGDTAEPVQAVEGAPISIPVQPELPPVSSPMTLAASPPPATGPAPQSQPDDSLPPPPPSSSVPPPPAFKLGKSVSLQYLKRTPLAFAKDQRIACVDYQAPDTYWFITDNVAVKTPVIQQIAKQNKLTAHVFPVGRHDLDDLLAYYGHLMDEEAKAQKEHGKQVEIDHQKEVERGDMVAKMAADQPEMIKMAPGVVVQDVPATILSTENEQGGLVGIIQRFGHSFTTKSEMHEVEAIAESGALDPSERPGKATPSVPQASPVPVIPPPVTSAAPSGITVMDPDPGIPAKTDDAKAVKDDEQAEIGKLLDRPTETIEDLKAIIKKGSIPKLVAATVDFAIHERASDIHIEAFEDEVRVRFRMDGQLVDIVKLAPDVHSAVVSRIKILTKLRLDETRVPQDGRFNVNFEHAQVDLRVSLMPTVHGEKVVMRILDKNRGVTSLDTLGIMGLAYQNILKAIEKPFGVCLATGPTGSGKSTSLYAILKQIATPNVNVVTLEDPVEFEMKGINQSQIRPKIGFTFADGLRAILRQDPNIIMVGEIRDGETASMATQAALTGHLVLSTLHTNDAAGAIPRLQNMGIEPFLITSSLNVAMGQRLVRKICQNCKAPINLPGGLRDQFAKDVESIGKLNPVDAKRVPSEITFYQGMGCSVCKGKGYTGRLGIYEVLVMSEQIEELALKRSSGSQIKDVAQKEGMLTMYQDGMLKVVAGLTTLDEVLRETSTK